MVRVQKNPTTWVLTIARPSARNALNFATLESLRTLVGDANDDRSCRGVVLTGEGAMFAAGGDLRELRPLTSESDAQAVSAEGAKVCSAIMASRVPFIAAIGGPAIGGGAELAMACDLRVMSASATICFKHARMGVTTSWGVLPKLIAQVGPSFASRLLLLSEECGAADALRHGLVDAIVPDGEQVESALLWAAECAKGAPLAMSGLKELINAAAFGAANSRDRELARFVETWTSRDHAEAVDAFFERRSPLFGK